MSYHIEATTVSDKVDLLWPLLVEHREELTTHKHIMPLRPATERYKALEDAGAMLALVAYQGEEIVGYAIGVVTLHLHYAMTYYQNDVLFVSPAHRKSRLGSTLIQLTEALAKARGACFVAWHAKPDTALCTLLERKGYGVQDIMYGKEI